MNDWVPCYRALMKGRKRSLPRATRFIFLELCHEAREGGGIIELAPGLSLGEAIFDIIGGNRRELHAAVATLTEEQMIDAHSQPGFLLITNWDRWKLRDLTNAERQARWRERKRNGKGNGESNGVSNAPVTGRNVTLPSPDQIRRDQKRKRSAVPPLADHDRGVETPAPKPESAKTTDPDFEAELAHAAAVAEAKKRAQGIAPPAPLSTAIVESLQGKKP